MSTNVEIITQLVIGNSFFTTKIGCFRLEQRTGMIQKRNKVQSGARSASFTDSQAAYTLEV